MNPDHSVPPSQLGGVSTVAFTTTQHSNRTSPFPPTTTTDKEAMAAPGFMPAIQAFRPAMSAHHSPYPLNMTTVRLLEREPAQPIGAPFAKPSSPMVRVLIRRLPLNTSEESLRLMVVWSKDVADVGLLPIEQSEDPGFRSALMRFRSMAGAMEVKSLLDGRSNISNDAEMIVEVLSTSPGPNRRNNIEPSSANPSSATSSAASSAPGSRQPSRFNGAFHPLERISPTSNEAFPVNEVPEPDASAHYMNLFSPQSPIGNYLTERPRISGKTLINNNADDDDETSDLLKDPVAYAENGATGQRRATAPQLPIGRMANLTLSTNNPPAMGPSSLPPYANSMSAHPGPMSPLNGSGTSVSYPVGGGQPYTRHNFPPVNPADQNPPCNTLYVGNLPIDTSEEELKAMFSKQRGYKRLCFRTKQNGPMCFVEFEDVSFATKTLHELYGQPLHNSVKGGIRLSFSKNPLGVRSGQAPGPPPSNNINGAMNGMMSSSTNGFAGTANGPPPGLSAPPGLGPTRVNYNLASTMSSGSNHPYNVASFPNGTSMHPWNGSMHHNGLGAGANGSLNGSLNRAHHNGSGTSSGNSSSNGNPAFLPPHMMGR
jgi:hypothetical protein